MSDGDPSKNEADQRTFIALLLLMAVAGLLLALVAIVLPQVLGIVVVIGGMGMFAVSHYVVWGWWLPRYLKRLSEQDDQDNYRSWVDAGLILCVAAVAVVVLFVILYVFVLPPKRPVAEQQRSIPRTLNVEIRPSKETSWQHPTARLKFNT